MFSCLKTDRATRPLTFLIAFTFALLPRIAHADAVDDLIQLEMKTKHIPGVSITVLRDGKPIKTMGYGFANVESQAPATADTVYQLASVTKQFTAVAVMQLVEAGKISLDDTLPKYFPDCPEAWKPVTIRHLLNHTSGIKSYTSLADFGKNVRKDYTREELIGLVRNLPLDFAPGTKWAYNNSGYFLLGMILEKVSGKNYETVLKEQIFSPLGMANTRLNDLSVVIPHRAEGYGYSNGNLHRGEYVSPTQPFAAGALVSTISDMAKWDAALDGEKLLKRTTLAQMWMPTKLTDGRNQNYGFGFSTDIYHGHRRVHHGGGIDGFSTFTLRLPDDKLSVIVLTNLEGGAADGLAQKIAASYIPELAPKELKAIADPEPELTKRLRGVVEGFAKGEAKESDFTEGMWKFLYPDRLKEGSAPLRDMGPLATFELVERSAEGSERKLTYKALFGSTVVVVGIQMAGNKIAGIRFGSP